MTKDNKIKILLVNIAVFLILLAILEVSFFVYNGTTTRECNHLQQDQVVHNGSLHLLEFL